MAIIMGMIMPRVRRLSYFMDRNPQTNMLPALTSEVGRPMSKVLKLLKPNPLMTRVPKFVMPPFGMLLKSS
jgi:hypothetical protein